MSEQPFVDRDGVPLEPNDNDTHAEYYCCYHFSISNTIEKGDDRIYIDTRTSGINFGFKTTITCSNENLVDDEGNLYHGQILETNGQDAVIVRHQKINDNIEENKPADDPRE